MATPDYLAKEQEIAELLQDDDMYGIELLCEHLAPRVKTRLLRRFGTDREELIDDFLVDAAVRVWEQRDQFDPNKGRLVTWYATIATNTMIGALRLEAARPVVEINWIMDVLAEERTVSARSELVERLLATLPQCIEELPKLQREIILADLEAGEPVSPTELAKRFGTTPNSVSVSRNRALRKLGVLLRHRCGLETVR